jgi:hypothetical protein
MTPVDTLGEPVTVVDALGEPVVLINEDGTPAFLAYSAKTYLGGVAPYHWLDFINNRALYASVDVGNVTQATGYSFTRASDGYYTNSDGTLTLFGSGALRRGDRGVLIEGSRTNLLVRSQEFDDAAWGKPNATVTANATTAPDGTLTADRVTFTAPTSTNSVSQNVTVAAGAYTASVFLKYVNTQWVQLFYPSSQFTGGVANFDLINGVIGSTVSGTATITALGNGWYRCGLTRTSAGAGSVAVCQTVPVSSGAAGRFGSEVAGSYDIWQADFEAGSFPSSPIVTTTASATRAADVLTYTAGVSYPIQLWSEFERAVDTGVPEGIVQVDASSRAQRANMNISGVNADRLTAGTTGGVSAAGSTMGVNVTVGANTKAAGRYQSGNVLVAQNGSLGTASTDPNNIPSTPDTLRIGDAGSAANPLFGYIRRIAIIQGAGTDAQLQSMTGS